MRTVYLGTSEFAAAVLRRLAGSPPPAARSSSPRRTAARAAAARSGPPPAAEAARELGIELLQTENVNERGGARADPRREPEAVAVCAFGQLIREPLLSEWPMLNVHPSLLPRWRGAAPIERAIMAGDERTGVSVMRVTEGLDSGPVALARGGRDRRRRRLRGPLGEAAAIGGELLVRLDLLAEGGSRFEDQDDDEATYAEKISSATSAGPGRPASSSPASVRALTPASAPTSRRAGERLGVGGRAAVDVRLKDGKLQAESVCSLSAAAARAPPAEI